ncbi:MAG: DNA (cytosine-5-)-methyltransferase [Anaerolineaceae bacterium]|nr:DNA (cytosine-5-)-methyltransferase [Anaerolineaceae bacterium]
MTTNNYISHKGEENGFTFIDLFAGIGGLRIAFEAAGGHCVFSSEYDRFAQTTYETFFGERPDFANILMTDPPGDITKISPELVPNHDILTGGFPCQPFSLAGVSKKQSLGKPHGFQDPTQGTLFFNIKSILDIKRPKAFLLENVKNLRSHDKGKTYRVIMETLDEIGYTTFDRIVDAAGWIPQHRERLYIAGFRRPQGNQYWEVTDFPEFMKMPSPDNRILDLEDVLEDRVPERYTLGLKTWATLERHKQHHESIGQGFGYSLISPPFIGKVTRTLSARYHKDGAEILIKQDGKRPRRLTPLECCRLMGYPDNYQLFFERNPEFQQPVSDTQAYRQFGNSVAVPVVTRLAQLIIDKLVEEQAFSDLT